MHWDNNIILHIQHPIEGDFLFGSEVTAIVVVDNVDLDGGFGVGSRQAFFEREGWTVMDSDKRLRCLLWNLVLKLEAMSPSSSSSSQIIGGTGCITPASGLSLEDEEEDEADNEYGETGGGVLPF